MPKAFILGISRDPWRVFDPLYPKRLRHMANRRAYYGATFGYSSERLDLFVLAGIPSVSSSLIR